MNEFKERENTRLCDEPNLKQDDDLLRELVELEAALEKEEAGVLERVVDEIVSDSEARRMK